MIVCSAYCIVTTLIARYWKQSDGFLLSILRRKRMSGFEKQNILSMILNSSKCIYINTIFITLCLQYTKPISLKYVRKETYLTIMTVDHHKICII